MIVMMVFDIVVKSSMSERKIGFDFVFESEVEGIPSWSKASNRSHIENGEGYHSTTEVKGVSRTFPKVKG